MLYYTKRNNVLSTIDSFGPPLFTAITGRSAYIAKKGYIKDFGKM